LSGRQFPGFASKQRLSRDIGPQPQTNIGSVDCKGTIIQFWRGQFDVFADGIKLDIKIIVPQSNGFGQGQQT
jgi:hypothetical protein